METVQITEEFDDPRGVLTNYDAYAQNQRDAVRKRKHVDIRVFENGDQTTAQTVLNLSTMQQSQLAAMTVSAIQAPTVLKAGEAWTGGTVAKQADRSNLRGISIVAPATATSVNPAVDISTGFDGNDFITIAAIVPAGLNWSTSMLQLTSRATPDWTNEVAFATFASNVNGTATGNCEIRWPRSAFSGINLANITGVRLVIQGTGTFRALAIRLVSKDWTYLPLDLDTRYGQLRLTVPPNADTTAPPVLQQPILFRSAIPSGENDPRPIDGELGVIFNTGSITDTNQFTLYFRELTEDFMQMLDLDGDSMASFDGRVMPDVGTARYNSRTMADLDPYNQDTLAGESQYSLERTSDALSASWVSFTVQWSNVGANNVAQITNSENIGYNLTLPTLSANTTYAAYAHLEEKTAWLRIFAVDAAYNVTNKVFDSTSLPNDFAFKRRKGRVGWFASLKDGDAYIDSIRSRGMTYGEYRSLPYESFTPVVGAELFVSTTPNHELVTGMAPGPYNGPGTTVTQDSAQSTTGESWRVTMTGDRPAQGLQSNIFNISDFENARLTFDIYYPSSLSAFGLNAILLDKTRSRSIGFILPQIQKDRWQTITANFPNLSILAGDYRLFIYNPNVTVGSFWVDNVHLYERTTVWDGRATVDDPWGAVQARWMPFYDNHSKESAGVLFPRRGNMLQIRGRARRPEARIERIQFKPKYAELGRLVWTTNPVWLKPVADFTSTSIGTRAVRLTSIATDPDGQVVTNEWNFGDGSTGIGPVVDHTYATTGVYTVTLISTDNNGQRGTAIKTVAV